MLNAFKVKEIRRKLLFTFGCLVLVRLGSLIPAPGINNAVAVNFLDNTFGGSKSFIDALTGGALTQLSIFALNISPYITSSIIMQLLTIAIPALAEMQKDGESGRKQIEKISRYVTVLLALIEGTAMAIGFKNQNGIVQHGWLGVILVVIAFTAGSAFLMWLGENITEYGVGNGISIILLINIVANFPMEFGNLFKNNVFNRANFASKFFAFMIILVLILVMLVLVVILQDAERKIAVQYSQKMAGRRMQGGNSSCIPLKVNTAGVMPVIFAVSIFQFPIIISSFFNKYPSRTEGFWGKVLYMCKTENWFDFTGEHFAFKYTIGAVFYIAMIIFFAYFYTSITFNPVEIAGNLKKSGGFIPGIRPGKPTIDFLTDVLNKVVLIGAIGLTIVALIPIVSCGAARVSGLGFGGTSIIIVVGVILETVKQIESMMLTRHYRGFLSE